MSAYDSNGVADRLNPRYDYDGGARSCRDGRKPLITWHYLSSIRRSNPTGRRGSYLLDILRRIQEGIQSKREKEGAELGD